MMNSIVLTGISGSGKTTVAEILSSKLNFGFVDIDFIIEQKEKCSISEIFEIKGEEYFRTLESDTIEEVLDENQVIALGGGAFENEKIRNLLLSKTNVFYLKTSPQTVLNRLKDKHDRPLLQDISLDKILSMLNRREKHYELAHYTVLTDNKSSNEVVKEILKCLN